MWKSMSGNNRADSNDSRSTDTGMNADRRDDRQNTDTGMNADRRDTGTNADHRDVNDDHGYRDDNANRERGDNNADEMNTGGRGKLLSPMIALLGVWMVALAFVLDVTGSHFWSAVLVGALLIGVGAYNYSRQANERLANSAIALIAVAAGLWLIAAPYVLGGDAGLTESAYELWFYNHVAVGLLAVGLGAYTAYTSRDHQQDTQRTKA